MIAGVIPVVLISLGLAITYRGLAITYRSNITGGSLVVAGVAGIGTLMAWTEIAPILSVVAIFCWVKYLRPRRQELECDGRC